MRLDTFAFLSACAVNLSSAVFNILLLKEPLWYNYIGGICNLWVGVFCLAFWYHFIWSGRNKVGDGGL